MNRDKFLKSFAQYTLGLTVDVGKFSKNENLFAGIIQARAIWFDISVA